MKLKHTLIFILTLALIGCGGKVAEQTATDSPPLQPASTLSPQTGRADTATIEPVDCPFTLPQGFTEGENVSCGYLLVPEDRADQDSKTIRLAVATFSSANPEKAATPVVYIEGGPGASALEPLSLAIGKYMPLLQKHDVIFYDQRGVGLSEPALDCPAYTELGKLLLENDFSGDEILARTIAASAECRQYFGDQGIDLAMYNTHQSAADLEDLRLALGFDTWDIYSISYGTRVALETMRQYPEGIRSVVLDSPVPPEADPMAEAAQNAGQALDLFFSACRNHSSCGQSYPDLENTFFNTAAALDEQPIQLPISNLLTGEQFTASINGSDFISIIINGLYSAEILPVLPLVITETAQGNYTKLLGLQSNFITTSEFISTGMLHTVRCHDEIPFTTPEKISQSLENYPELTLFIKTSGTKGSAIFDLCAELQAGTAAADQNQPVSSSIPTLILNGRFDPATPPRWGQQIAENLENSLYYEFEAVGHGPSLSHPCPNQMMLDFLSDPTNKPDNLCMPTMEISFTLPVNLANLEFMPIEVPDYGIQAIAPIGWIPVKPEYYVSPDQKIELVIAENRSEPVEDFLAKWNAGEVTFTPTYNDVNWQVHPIDLSAKNVAGFLAVSESDNGFYFVLIIGPQDLNGALHENIFLKVLQAFYLITP